MSDIDIVDNARAAGLLRKPITAESCGTDWEEVVLVDGTAYFIPERSMRPFLHYAGTNAHFQWNLDSSVGKGAQNSSPCDISYIQWYYTLAAKHPNTPAVRKAVYSKVKVTGSCNGTTADPLVQAILAHQTALKHPYIDGKISVATGDGRVGELAFFILRLGARLSDMYPQYWPRLDQIPACPGLVATAVKGCVPRVSA